ncbi:cation-translocating P-type ATPase [Actinokineospora auranticolor]|uniref:Ca2+-transporting ATPase n=1 Tax=Actinokineospora auranticolor TaxID=155976 RepID=A0A2S6GIX3_9PSEU|nr:cation-translocating P-type ATPase [Actinokineospora auranticolor]PPK65157.1 Ca2+-transporting ATPase [Actinokineospora auranticolor]
MAQTPVTDSPRGLTDAEAAEVRARVGHNLMAEPKRAGRGARVLAQLRDPMVLLLLVAAALALVLGDFADVAVIGAVVVLNTAVGVAQQSRAERALAALRSMSAPTATVVRDGTAREVPSAEVVPGDVVVLTAGDVVAADAALVRAHALRVDEAAVTGESVPVDKPVGGEVAAGTVVTHGRGVAVVNRTGPDSGLGRIAALVGAQRPRPTPLQRRLADLGRVLALAAVGLSVVVAAIGLARGEPVGAMALTAISLAVAAVPESLPAVVTLALALGAHRMAQRRAVVRSLPAVETLGSVTVLATDKTGTITEGRMVAERVWTPERGEVDPGAELPAALLRAVVLCNDADPRATPGDDRVAIAGDPLEVALLSMAAAAGVDCAALRDRHPRIDELPFDSERGRMTTVHQAGEHWLVVSKGAPETLLAEGTEAVDAAERLARRGYRVLAVAAGGGSGAAPGAAAGERAVRLLGLVALADPPRSDSAEVVTAFQEAGIELVMITGDHPRTAASIADRVGIGDGGEVRTGEELAARGAGAPGRVRVYARTRPEQKQAIVRAWQDEGHVVAMTGDGVNDAPALRRADIGVAMGGGTEVARQAADLVLTDDNLGTVATAVEEGRRIHANVRTFLRYAVSGGVAEVLVMLTGPLLGLPVPLRPGQILWINLLTHGLPGVAIGAEPAAAGAMRARPRPPGESILGAGLWARTAWTGALIAAVTLGVGVWAAHTGREWQTLVFLCLGLAQLGVATALRRPGARPRFLDLAVIAAVALQLAGAWLPPLRDALGTAAVPVGDLLPTVVAATVPGLVVRALRRRENRSPETIGRGGTRPRDRRAEPREPRRGTDR